MEAWGFTLNVEPEQGKFNILSITIILSTSSIGVSSTSQEIYNFTKIELTLKKP